MNKNKEIPVLQVVGYQNSGKTTFITKLLRVLKERGYRVGSLKHHGHDGDPLYNDKNKDTSKYRSSGAVVTGVMANGQLQVTSEDQFSLVELLDMYQSLSLDMILVEGFKSEPFPKIVLLRTPEDENLLGETSNIVLIVSWYRPLPSSHLPVFSILDESVYLFWAQNFLQENIVLGKNGYKKKASCKLD